MKSADFAFPTPTLFGPGRRRDLVNRLANLRVQRPLLVTDPGFRATPAFKSLADLLPGVPVCDAVHGNPLADDVTAVANAFTNGRCDAIVAVGGGSPLDVGKLARWLAVHPTVGLDGFSYTHDYPPLPRLVAIPTTAGTGSEVGRSSVVTLGGHKRVFFHPRLLADLVILDPELTVDLPPRLTAATGADAFTHCLESLTSPVFHPLCDAIALEGLRIAFEQLPRACSNAADLEARGLMQIAAAMGGIAFQKDLGAVHSLSHPLSARCGLHHGTANALCLVPVMQFNAARQPGLYQRVATALDLPDSSDRSVIAAVRDWLQGLGLGGGLRPQGVAEDLLPDLAEDAFADACHQTNPVPVTQADLLELYRAAL